MSTKFTNFNPLKAASFASPDTIEQFKNFVIIISEKFNLRFYYVT